MNNNLALNFLAEFCLERGERQGGVVFCRLYFHGDDFKIRLTLVGKQKVNLNVVAVLLGVVLGVEKQFLPSAVSICAIAFSYNMPSFSESLPFMMARYRSRMSRFLSVQICLPCEKFIIDFSAQFHTVSIVFFTKIANSAQVFVKTAQKKPAPHAWNREQQHLCGGTDAA